MRNWNIHSVMANSLKWSALEQYWLKPKRTFNARGHYRFRTRRRSVEITLLQGSLGPQPRAGQRCSHVKHYDVCMCIDARRGSTDIAAALGHGNRFNLLLSNNFDYYFKMNHLQLRYFCVLLRQFDNYF